MMEREEPAESLNRKLIAMSKLTNDNKSLMRAVLEAERATPDDPTILTLKGWVQSNMGEYDKALESFDRAIGENPRSAWAYFRKGQTLARQEKYPKALECLTKAVKLKPLRPDFWIEKARSEDELGALTDAFSSYEKAIQLGDKTGLGWYGKSRILTHLNRLEEALEAVRNAIKLCPDDDEFKNGEAHILDKLSGY
jgi:tetratricopeptide (TPR) repeat protein